MLPAQPTPLFGRDEELGTAREQLLSDEVRLLTLLGPGGVGKTRLAVAIAESLYAPFPDGVWFVDLAPLRDARLVVSAIAHALGVMEAEHQPVLETLQKHLADRHLLLVLDNLEHLLQAAPDIAHLLGHCRGLTILATSREPLRLRWERTLPLGPLPLPDPDPRHLPPLPELAQVPAVALFLGRARAIQPQFALTAENAPAIASLCVRLDGLPLAIELVAARAALLGPAAILSRLERHLPLPHAGGLDAPERHQTIRGAISWSYDLLTAEERTVFCRAGVFAGGWTLEAAEAICGEDEGRTTKNEGSVGPSSFVLRQSDILDILTSLADKSLVQVAVQPNGEPRFRLLETVREFALEQLTATGEGEATRQRHVAYFLALAERVTPLIAGPDQHRWMDHLEREHDNLRAALEWLLERSDVEDAQLLCSLLGYFWWIGGHLAEGRRWLSEAIKPSQDTPFRVAALVWYAILAYGQGDIVQATVPLEEALTLALAQGNRPYEAMATTVQGLIAWRRGDTARAIELHREALRIAREVDDSWMIGDILLHLGFAEMEHDAATAAEALSESVDRLRKVGGPHQLMLALGALADARAQQGLDDEAKRVFREAFDLGLTGGDPISTTWVATLALAFLAERGKAEQATPLLVALESHTDSVGYRQTPMERAATARAANAARAELGEARYVLLRQAGPAVPPGEILRLASSLLEDQPSPPAREPAPVASTSSTTPRSERGLLSPREQEVLALVAEGLSNKEIARRLIVSESTAKYHVTSLFNKLGANTRAQVIARAAALGMLPPQ
ncbi:MAG TPA: LuxR C-terminal-related transcriptional regulator [Chloroflexota bacterium]|nr:LuxR C-terminal-related transcriptional regulator [Chloroflexota bacterium]